MECPFSLEIKNDDENDDPEHDSDEAMMQQEVKNKIQPIEDFKVQIQKPPVSEFDKNHQKKLDEEA